MGLDVQKVFLKNGDIKTFLRASKMEWISRVIHLEGKPFDFTGRGYLKPIYNNNFSKLLLVFGRQCEKSTALANNIIISSAVTPNHKTLYVSPSYLQTRQFSSGKLKPWIANSPIISKYLISSADSHQVMEKTMRNGSEIYLRAAFLTADRARGISADLLCLDEIQDLLTSNIPVIEECLSHAKDPREIMSGTPKTLENPIEQFWQQSSMCEWLVPCDRHSPVRWNYLDEKCIGKTGPICNKCGNPINPANGKWVAFNNAKDIMGFRVGQISVPWIYQNEKKWKDLLYKRETYSKGNFYNEVLGISYDSASKPITRTELAACCSSQHPFRHRPDAFTSRVEVFAGIDYGEGSDGTERGAKGKVKNASYTILALGMYLDQKRFHIFYYRRFTGKDALPGNCINEIIQTLKAFKVKVIGADWGHGWGVNERLEDVFGPQRVIKFQHVGNQKQRKKYDDIGHKFQLSRNEVMTDFFLDVKDHKIVWPEWESVKDYLCDFEHVFAEYKESSRQMVYDHKVSEPDDAVHASIYCIEAAKNYYGKV